jgi:hypothetical protein
MYYIGLDVHKLKVSYCLKNSGGKLCAERWIPATRQVDLPEESILVINAPRALVERHYLRRGSASCFLLIVEISYGVRLVWRWRRASKRTTPVATLTLRDLTGPVVGRETRKSQRLRVSSWRPLPSPPMTMPVGVV